jgi:predicted neutral ceramidase superfamily lipid hydrolase
MGTLLIIAVLVWLTYEIIAYTLIKVYEAVTGRMAGQGVLAAISLISFLLAFTLNFRVERVKDE